MQEHSNLLNTDNHINLTTQLNICEAQNFLSGQSWFIDNTSEELTGSDRPQKIISDEKKNMLTKLYGHFKKPSSTPVIPFVMPNEKKQKRKKKFSLRNVFNRKALSAIICKH